MSEVQRIENHQIVPLTQAATIDVQNIFDQIKDVEKAYNMLVEMAFRTTTNNDWMSQGDNPYLLKTGCEKIALRFNLSSQLNRDRDGNVSFVREEFTDEKGEKFYNYQVTGEISLPSGRKWVDIGTCSTRDQFLGMENEYDENKKFMGKKAVALHESTQDAKKKAITNCLNRLIKSFLALGGFTWADLEKYGISPAGKAGVKYGDKSGKKPTMELPAPPIVPKGSPMWTYDLINKQTNKPYERRIYVKVGETFDDAFVKLHKLIEHKTPGTYWAIWSDALWEACEKRAIEMQEGPFANEPA